MLVVENKFMRNWSHFKAVIDMLAVVGCVTAVGVMNLVENGNLKLSLIHTIQVDAHYFISLGCQIDFTISCVLSVD